MLSQKELCEIKRITRESESSKYDDSGRLLERKTFLYDKESGKLMQSTVSSTSYDEYGRILTRKEKTVSEGREKVSEEYYEYDKCNKNLITYKKSVETDKPTFEEWWTYNANGLNVSYKTSNGTDLAYSYDSNNNMISCVGVRVFSGKKNVIDIHNEYNKDGRLVKKIGNGKILELWEYDKLDRCIYEKTETKEKKILYIAGNRRITKIIKNNDSFHIIIEWRDGNWFWNTEKEYFKKINDDNSWWERWNEYDKNGNKTKNILKNSKNSRCIEISTWEYNKHDDVINSEVVDIYYE